MNTLRFFARVAVLAFVILLVSHQAPSVRGQTIETPKLDVVLIVDESDSMWDVNDIPKARVDALNLLIDTLGARDRALGEDVRVSIIAFGSEAQLVLPFTPVNTSTVDTIKQQYRNFNESLASPNTVDGDVGMGWTNVLHALQIAEDLLTNTDPTTGHRPDHKPVIIIMSDGKPETNEVNEGVSDYESKLAAYIEQIRQQAAAFQSEEGGLYYYEGACQALKQGWVPIYTVAIRQGANLPPNYQDIWRALADQNGGAYYASEGGSTLSALGSSYYEIYTNSICQQSQLEPATVAPGQPFERQYQVNNLYTSILFTVLKEDENIQVEIFRPGSTTPLSENEPGVILNESLLDEVWSINRSEPWEGAWTVRMTGNGRVLFAYELFTDQLQINTLSPLSNFVRACAPLDIALMVVNSQGTPITESVEQLTLSVVTPADEAIPLGTVPVQDDVFSYRYEDTCLDGEYNFQGTFAVSSPQDEALRTELTWNQRVFSTLDPYISVINPDGGTYYTTEPVPLQVDVMVGPALAEAVATQNPPVTAIISRNGTPVGEPIQLVYNGSAGPARMAGEIPLETVEELGEGEYSVEFAFEAPESASVEVARSTFTIDFAPPPVTATPSPTPSPTAAPTVTAVPAPTVTPTPPPLVRSEPPPIPLILCLVGVALAVAVLLLFSRMPSMLPFELFYEGVPQMIGRKAGGKLPETRTFLRNDGSPVKLEFRPDTNEGDKATRVTLMNDVSDASFNTIRIGSNRGGESLMARGEHALITKETEWLMIDGKRHDINTY